MTAKRILLGALLLAVAFVVAKQVRAQAFDHGQVEETPYVPTPQIVVDAMLDIAAVKAGDYLIDLGSGDGRIVISAVRERGARGFGVDINPTLVHFANHYARELKLGPRARFVERDVLKTSLADASVITMYLLPNLLEQLKPKLFSEPKPGTRIVSHDADFSDWPADRMIVINVPNKPVGPRPESKIRLWIVPARVAGAWRSEAGDALTLEQTYQRVAGTLRLAGGRECAVSGALDGATMKLTACSGEELLAIEANAASGALLMGTITDARGSSKRWRASKTAASRG